MSQHLKDKQRIMAEEQKQEKIAFNGAGTEGHVKAPKGQQEKTCFVTFVQSRRGVVHVVGKVQNINEQTKMDHLRNGSENNPLQVELTRLAPWEYHFAENLFEFDDDFYTIYGTSVAQEGRFMAPNVYAREFVHPDDIWILEASFDKALTFTERYFSGQFEHRVIRRDGEVRNIIVRITIIRDNSGKIVKWYGANQDITEQKAMEEDLRISREKLSLAVDLAHLGPWEYHPDKHLFEFGEEFYAIYGTSVVREGRFMAPNVYAREFVHPDDAWIVEAAVDKELASTGTYTKQLEHRIIRRDGEVRTIIVRISVIRDAAGNIRKWYGANQDITERVQAEQKLRESEKRLNATLNTLPDMLFRINEEGTLLDYRIPDQYARYPVKIIDEQGVIFDILPMHLTKLMKEMVTLSLKTGKTRMEEYLGQINGAQCCLQIRTAAIDEKEALIIIQDQTELYKSRKEFQRLDKLDLIGKMAAGIGHEVRNPLTTVRGYLQFLSSKELFQAHTDMFSLMIDELDRSNAIITEFLSLSRNKMVQLEPKNLNNIVQAIYPLLSVDALTENKTISLELDSDIPDINLDESEIRQLIINFVRNGLEAMTDKGLLTIRTWCEDRHVILAVRDSGSGIPASLIDKIGTPFVTTKEQGTGLGLSVCYSIAARHQAIIDYKTDKNGTEFTVLFNRIKQE
jgi:PAS domain S-box-containing protein